MTLGKTIRETERTIEDAKARKAAAYNEFVTELVKALNKLTGRRFKLTKYWTVYSKGDVFHVDFTNGRYRKVVVTREVANTTRREDYSSSGAYASNCYPSHTEIYKAFITNTLTANNVAKAIVKVL